MCGIAGYLGWRGENAGETLRAMAASLWHRGPDDGGVWLDPEAGIGLAHRRLAILDLSPHGHQPMRSAGGRFVLAFNGEIYNFLELRRELTSLGHPFRGNSDTEVMLACFEQWGAAESLKRFQGMFAFALWDREERTLLLARDRVGEKPLYYGVCRGSFLFGSELKALRKHPDWSGGIDPLALNLFFRYTYLPAPYSIHPGVAKLAPGCYLTVRCRKDGSFDSQLSCYWSIAEVARSGLADPFRWSEREAVAALEERLSAAVARQMIADVPLGVFLSGGYDSSTVVSLMQRQSPTPVKTFSIGFREDGFDEAQHARAIARHLGTEHTELYVTERESIEVIPRLPSLYDEPFADSSQIPTYLLARLARQQVTVSLSGDGGDELFCGYNRYELVERYWGRIGRIPHPLRKGIGRLASRLPVPLLDGICLAGRPLLPAGLDGERVQRLGWLFGAKSPHALAEQMSGYHRWADALVKVGGGGEGEGEGEGEGLPRTGSRCIPSEMMLMDFLRYLPDDILVKVDRAAMGVSLETRIPLLDPEVIELVWRLPIDLKRRDGERKWILRQILYKYVPRPLVDRPKMGFGVPIEHWLRGPLRDWAESLLSREALSASGLLDPAPIRQKWLEHQSGRQNWRYQLWPVLMFQSWYQQSAS